MTDYETCPNCGTAVLTAKYKQRYGQCWACYERSQMTLGQRIGRAIGRRR